MVTLFFNINFKIFDYLYNLVTDYKKIRYDYKNNM